MRFGKTLRAAALGLLAMGVGATAFRAEHAGRPGPQRPLLGGAQIDPQSLAIVERACQNCHSERTEWPWYSRVPPASWMVHRDVEKARERFNLSKWEGYSADEQKATLSAIGAAVRTGAMPPGRYTLLHPSGKLTPAEREELYRWTRSERSRLHYGTEKRPRS